MGSSSVAFLLPLWISWVVASWIKPVPQGAGGTPSRDWGPGSLSSGGHGRGHARKAGEVGVTGAAPGWVFVGRLPEKAAGEAALA